MPTYVPPPPDKNPMFLERRVNQGTSGRVYPNPLTDRLSNRKTDRPYRAVFLENEYIRLMILPEIGGRIHVGLDKTNGYHFFYRQHVIKPALIGLFGSWISGGVEFNWPQHHRPSTFMPVDHWIEEHADGSRAVWLSEHEPMDRMKGMVGICLHPGKALVEARVQLYNRTPFVQTFLWWVNVAVHVHEGYQIFFPPDVTGVTDHAKRAMSRYPIARGRYYGVDYGEGVDLSWYKNIPVPSSYFALESEYDFFGGYDHKRRAGLVHVADRHISPGKKMFTWGNAEFGAAWERNLTDDDGPYIELMSGVYTDNQPGFSWLQPYETKTFCQVWYPIQRIGPAKMADRRLALNLETDERQVTLGVCSNELVPRATVSLHHGERVLFEREVDLVPGAPLVEEVALDDTVTETDLLVRVCSRSGKELIRYRPVVPPEVPLPEPATPPPPPMEIEGAEELYLTGLHLEQYRHPTIDPVPYWERALQIDPADVRSNNALGLVHLRRGSFGVAEGHFSRAIRTLTRRNPNPRDGEPYYNLGLALKFQGRLDEAYDAFYKAIWSYAWQTASYYALAEIECSRAGFTAALDHLDRSLITNALHLKARDLKAAVLRRLDRHPEAEAVLEETIALDPLDFWARNEQVLLSRAQGDGAAAQRLEALSALMRADGGRVTAQTYADVAFDYANAGLLAEAGELLGRLVDRAGVQGPAPVIPLYVLGCFAHQSGDPERAGQFCRQASALPTDYVFPARLEEMQVLEHVLSLYPQDAKAHYYLGCLLYDKHRHDEAVLHWEAACQLSPGFSIPWRNLGIAYHNVYRDVDRAQSCYLKALEQNPHDARLLSELDQLVARLGAPLDERLARLEEHPDLVDQRDDLTAERARLYNLLDQPRKALKIILSRRFHPWEGGEGRVSDQYVAAHIQLARSALNAGHAETALSHLTAAGTFPESLGEGRYPLAPDAHLQYFVGLAKEALGDDAGAKACFEQAAQADAGISPVAYYRGLALRKLGQAEASRAALQALLDGAEECLEKAAQAGFAASVPSFVFFEDDPVRRRRAHYRYLTGLAHLGLGDVASAECAFGGAIAQDADHLAARLELERLRGDRPASVASSQDVPGRAL